MALFRLSFFCWGKIRGKNIVSPQYLLKGCIDFIQSAEWYKNSIEVKFDFDNHPKNFDQIIALYLLN